MKVSDCPQNKKITLLEFAGHIDSITAAEFSRQFHEVLAENKFNLVIDLSGVDYIGSAGWGVFIGELKRIRAQKGDLLLVGMSVEVLDVFNLLEFNAFLTSYPSVEAAIEKGFKHSPASGKTGKFHPEREK